jgi:hypothetical protein
MTTEARNERAKRARKELQGVWEFASVVAFLDSFEDVLKLAHPFDPTVHPLTLRTRSSVAQSFVSDEVPHLRARA